MIVNLKNEYIDLKINTHGAEINSLKDLISDQDIIWNGSPSVWNYHAPILFPHCGKIKDGYVLINGIKCPLKSNGFTRDLEHVVIKWTEQSVEFELHENEYTLERFPYKFQLNTKYKLVDNCVVFRTSIKNTDKRSFLFSMGSHSAFKIGKETLYQIEFEKREPLTQVVCLENGFLAVNKKGKCPYTKPYDERENGIIPVAEQGFGNGHLFADIKSDWIGLRNLDTQSLVKVNIKGYPYVMIWQNMGEPEFICLEPWYGMPDSDNTDHNWENKPGLISLASGAEFETDQSIFINNR